MDGQSHPTTRIVVDLDKACAYELTPGPAGKLVLTLHANAVAKAAAEAKTVAASSRRWQADVAVRAASDGAHRRSSGASAKPTARFGSAHRLCICRAFVSGQERSVKKDDAADEPTVRAQEAAARFSDKTAAELLPVSVHAAQAQSQGNAITPAVNLAAEQKAQAGQQPARWARSTRANPSRST